MNLTSRFLVLSSLCLALPYLLIAQMNPCEKGWCKTFPVGDLKATPPFGSSAWNKLVFVPDDHRFYLYTSDGIITFSNSWWSYGVLGHVATSNPWTEESTSGTVARTVTFASKGFLKSPIAPADTVILLRPAEASTFRPDPKLGGILIIDDEAIAYTPGGISKDGFIGVTRGVRGTVPAAHNTGTIVNGGAPAPQSRIDGKLRAVNDHLPDRHPFLAAAYDSRRHQLFQAGGIIEINKKTDTWYFCLAAGEYCPSSDVRVWKRLLTPTSVPGRADSAMAYDSDDDVMILYGGQSVGNPNSDTWLLCFSADPQPGGNKVGCPSGHTYPDWVRVEPAKGKPEARFAHSLVYDSSHHVAVMFGGVNGTTKGPNDVWMYSPGSRSWANVKTGDGGPASFSRPAMTYDPAMNRVVLYQGPPGRGPDGSLGGLFLFDAGVGKWETITVPGGPIPSSPGPARGHGRLSMDYDPETDTFVATELGAGYTLQTWELRGSVLRALNPRSGLH